MTEEFTAFWANTEAYLAGHHARTLYAETAENCPFADGPERADWIKGNADAA